MNEKKEDRVLQLQVSKCSGATQQIAIKEKDCINLLSTIIHPSSGNHYMVPRPALRLARSVQFSVRLQLLMDVALVKILLKADDVRPRLKIENYYDTFYCKSILLISL